MHGSPRQFLRLPWTTLLFCPLAYAQFGPVYASSQSQDPCPGPGPGTRQHTQTIRTRVQPHYCMLTLPRAFGVWDTHIGVIVSLHAGHKRARDAGNTRTRAPGTPPLSRRMGPCRQNARKCTAPSALAASDGLGFWRQFRLCTEKRALCFVTA